MHLLDALTRFVVTLEHHPLGAIALVALAALLCALVALLHG